MPPQCEYFSPLTSHTPEAASKLFGPVDHPTISAAKALWSTLAQLAADQKAKEPKKEAKELVPASYHRFL
jgi:hypothetical protein